MNRVPFSPGELEITGHIPPERPNGIPAPLLNTPVSPRENMRALLAGERPLWLPHQAERLLFNPAMLADNRARGFVVEETPFDQSRAGGPDMFGVPWAFDPAINGATPDPHVPPLVSDLSRWEEDVVFPDLDALDWAGCAAANRARLTCGAFTAFTIFNGLFERLWSFVGMTDALIALVDEDTQPAVHRLFDRLCLFYDGLLERVQRWFGCDSVWFHDDWGSQTGPLFSLDVCREMLAPYLKRLVDSAHRRGMYFEFHSCGKNEALVPAMVEAGVDLWAGQELNDKGALYRDWGARILLGVEPRPIPPDAPDEAVRAEIRRLLEAFPGGHIFIARHRGMHPREYPLFYEETRKYFQN